MNRLSLVALLVAGTLPFSVGCASKKYVRNQSAPTVNKVNELDDLTSKTTNEIRSVDQRAQAGPRAEYVAFGDLCGRRAVDGGPRQTASPARCRDPKLIQIKDLFAGRI